jgi:hypothetical protein
MIGEEPPANCKNLERHYAAGQEWWRSLDPQRKRTIERMLGLPIWIPAAEELRRT